MNGRHFRAGVGTVIYDHMGQVVLFRRCAPPADTWQFQQGGIDAGEQPETTLWRELTEETGLTSDDCATVTEYPDWTIQLYPEELLTQADQPNPDRLGQVQKWWFLELYADVVIDLAKATDKEFDDYKWVSWEEALTAPPPYKAHVYRQLHTYFNKHLLDT